MSMVNRASRFIFLNKTCFNGLYRENSSGQFNTPFGHYKNPRILDEDNLSAINTYLNSSSIKIEHCSYEVTCNKAETGDFVYLDPPYVPLTATASFANYTKTTFGLKQQEELAAHFAKLATRGVQVMLSNSNTDVVRELYKGFNIQTIHATRAISCKSSGRGKAANEVLVTSY